MRARLQGPPCVWRGGLEWLCPACQPKLCQMESGLHWVALLPPSKVDCLKENPLEHFLTLHVDSTCWHLPCFAFSCHFLPLTKGLT